MKEAGSYSRICSIDICVLKVHEPSTCNALLLPQNNDTNSVVYFIPPCTNINEYSLHEIFP